MKNILELAWEILPMMRRTRVANEALWIQLAITSREAERRINYFNACVEQESYIRMVRKKDALWAVIRIDLSKRCKECGAKMDEIEFETCERCFYAEID